MSEPLDPNPQPQETLLRPTGVNGEVSGVPRNPTVEDLVRLRNRAFKSKDGVDYGIYETALMRYYFKDFTNPNGIDRFAYTTYEREALNPINIFMRETLVEHTRSDGTIDYDALKPVIEAYITSQNNPETNSFFTPTEINHYSKTTSGLVSPFNTDKKTIFAAAFLHNAEHYRSAQDSSPSEYLRCNIEQQFRAFKVAEHESGHAINFLRDDANQLTTNEMQAGNDPKWVAHHHECLADTYAVLRMAAELGQNGVDGTTTLIRDKLVPDFKDKEHWTTRTMLNAQEYAQNHLHELQSKTPEEIYALALKIVQPIPKDEYAYLQSLTKDEFEQAIDRMVDNQPPQSEIERKTLANLDSDWKRTKALRFCGLPKDAQMLDQAIMDNTYNPADPTMRNLVKKYLDGYPKQNEFLPEQTNVSESFSIELNATKKFIKTEDYRVKLGPKTKKEDSIEYSKGFPTRGMFTTIASSLRLIAIHGEEGETYLQNQIKRLGKTPEDQRQRNYITKALEIAHKNPDKIHNLDREGVYDLAITAITSDPQLINQRTKLLSTNNPQEITADTLAWSNLDQGEIVVPQAIFAQHDDATSPPSPLPSPASTRTSRLTT